MRTFFVIQGHTRYITELLDCFKGTEDVIWAADEDAPAEDLERIRNSGMTLVLTPKRDRVLHNINIHVESSLLGVQKAIELGADYVVKLRSDMTISDPKKFIATMRLDGKIYGNCYIKHSNKYQPYAAMSSNTVDWLIRNCINIENCFNLNYITDWIYYAPAKELLYFYEVTKLTELNLDIIEELRLIGSYFTAKKININLTQEELNKHIGIFMDDMKQAGVDVYSLKEKLNYSRLDEVIPSMYVGKNK